MNTSRVCKAFANEDRLRLLVCLATAHTVTDLLGKCQLSQSALSQHLKVFRDAGVVRTRKSGKYISYRAADRTVVSIATSLLRYH